MTVSTTIEAGTGGGETSRRATTWKILPGSGSGYGSGGAIKVTRTKPTATTPPQLLSWLHNYSSKPPIVGEGHE